MWVRKGVPKEEQFRRLYEARKKGRALPSSNTKPGYIFLNCTGFSFKRTQSTTKKRTEKVLGGLEGRKRPGETKLARKQNNRGGGKIKEIANRKEEK